METESERFNEIWIIDTLDLLQIHC